MQGGTAAGDGEEQQPDGETEQTSAKLNGLLPTKGDGANKEEVPGGKATRAGKRTGDGIELSAAEATAEKLNADQQAKASSQGEETRAAIAEGGESPNDSSAKEKEGDARSSKVEAAEKVQIPAVENVAELTAAIERQVKLAEQSGATEAAAADTAPVASTDASNSNAASQKATATLDRLAATALRRSDESAQGDSGPQIDRPRFVQRVEGALRAAQQRDGRVQVRLAPPELGVVHIELAVQNGVMTAKLEAETANARNALLDNLPALRERLAEQNIRVEKFDVDVRRDPQQGGSNNAPNDRPDGRGEPNSHGRRGRTPTTLTNTATPRTARPTESASTTGLDIRI
jgi:flagellar hook-length control protein FliK